MKKRNILVYIGVLAVTFLLLLSVNVVRSFFSKEEGKDGKKQEIKGEYAIKAVYLRRESGEGIFVDLTNETPFFAELPTEEKLNNGDVVNLWGNGVVAQSYPAQYHGISRVERLEEKNQEYIEKYGHYLDEFVPATDLTQVPYLDVSYKTSQALVTAAVTSTGTYTWKYENEQGGTEEKTEEKPSVLQWSEITELAIKEKTDIELKFSITPGKISIHKWESQERESYEKGAVLPSGEEVKVNTEEKENPGFSAEPGYVYLIEAEWENGKVQYGFLTI